MLPAIVVGVAGPSTTLQSFGRSWPNHSSRLKQQQLWSNVCGVIHRCAAYADSRSYPVLRPSAGAWQSIPYVAERAPAGWKIRHKIQTGDPEPSDFGLEEDADFSDDSPDTRVYKKAWARLLSKVYEIDPGICPRCGSEMKVIAIIQETAEIDRILRHLVNRGVHHPCFTLAP